MNEFKLAMANLAANNASGDATRVGSFAYFGSGTGHEPAADLPRRTSTAAGMPATRRPTATRPTTWANSAIAGRHGAVEPEPDRVGGRSRRQPDAAQPGDCRRADAELLRAQPGGEQQQRHRQRRLQRLPRDAARAAAAAVERVLGERQLPVRVLGERLGVRRLQLRALRRIAICERPPRDQDAGGLVAAVRPRPALRQQLERIDERAVGGWSVNLVGRMQTVLQNFGNVRLVGMSKDEFQDMYKFTAVPNPATGIDEVWMLPEDVILNTRRAFSTSNTTRGRLLDEPRRAGRALPCSGQFGVLHPGQDGRLRAAHPHDPGAVVQSVRLRRAPSASTSAAARTSKCGSTCSTLFDTPNFTPVTEPAANAGGYTSASFSRRTGRLHGSEQHLRSGRPHRPADVPLQLVGHVMPPAGSALPVAVWSSLRARRVARPARSSSASRCAPAAPTGRSAPARRVACRAVVVDYRFRGADADGAPVADLQAA